TFANDPNLQASGTDLNFIASVVDRWRNATMNRAHVDDRAGGADRSGAPRPPLGAIPIPSTPPLATVPSPAAPAGGAPAGVDPARFNLLKKPPAERPDPLAALRAIQTPAVQR